MISTSTNTMPLMVKPLTHLRDLGPRVGEFAVAPLAGDQVAAVLEVLAGHYGSDLDPARLVPPVREAELRADLAARAPQLADLAAALHEALEGAYRAVIVPRLGLEPLPLADRSALLFALSVSLGRPTATDRLDRRVVWDVKVRPGKLENGSVSTFSEHPYEADLHTDTQYFAEPERYVLLYCLAPAACGGGISSMRDVQCVRQALNRTADGRWALHYLTGRDLPFRVPAVFTETGSASRTEVTFAPVFGIWPAIRFRSDTLRRGLDLHPEFETPELQRALGILDAELANHDRLVSVRMSADSLQVLNNHESLHGRSPFTDYNRHVLRIRVAGQPDVLEDRGEGLVRSQGQ